jgi:hypothetical protein
MKANFKKQISTSAETQENVLLAAFVQDTSKGWNKYQACRELGIDCLAARIKGLRYKGHLIDSYSSVIVDLFGIPRKGVKTYFYKGIQKEAHDEPNDFIRECLA